MTKQILWFGLALAALLGLMKWIEYSFFIKDLTLETYLGIVGVICAGLGIWMGTRFRSKKETVSQADGNTPTNVLPSGVYNPENEFNLSPREFEVLTGIAKGQSYQQIADDMHVSLSTVKTHASNIFSKMDVQRRTQAVMMAQQKGLLPPMKG